MSKKEIRDRLVDIKVLKVLTCYYKIAKNESDCLT